MTVNLAAGGSTTVGPFPAGTSCTVTEPVLPTPPANWTFGVPVILGSPAVIVKGDAAAAVAVSVTNSISRIVGSPAAIVKGNEAAAVAVSVTNSIIHDPAKIIVDKVTIPSGSLVDFEFNPSWSELNFLLKDGSDSL